MLLSLPKDYHTYDTHSIWTNIFIIIPAIYLFLHRKKKTTLTLLLPIHILLIGLTSIYYHMDPSDERLTYDMMSIATTTILVLLLIDKFPQCPILLYTLAIVSVVIWKYTDNLLPYIVIIKGIPIYIAYQYYSETTKYYNFGSIGTLNLLRYFDRATTEHDILSLPNHSLKHVIAGIHIMIVILFLQKLNKI